MAYYALVRLYYLVDGKKVCAPADSVVTDFPEDEVERAIERGYLREATVGEVAEAQAKADAAPKKGAVAKPKRGPKAKTADAATSDKKPADADDADKKPADAGADADKKSDLA